MESVNGVITAIMAGEHAVGKDAVHAAADTTGTLDQLNNVTAMSLDDYTFQVDSACSSTLTTPEDAVDDPMGGLRASPPLSRLPPSTGAMTGRRPLPIHTGPIPSFYSIIPAGGSGTRLWPLSRDSRPKFLLDLEGNGGSLLQNTWNRLRPLSYRSNIVVVTGNAHASEVGQQLLGELEGDNLVTEPCPKESMAAIGLAAAICLKRDPDAIVGSFAADHVMPAEDKNPQFYTAVREAVRVAQAHDVLVTIGIQPTEPSTAFGYIHIGAPASESDRDAATSAATATTTTTTTSAATGDHAFRVSSFKEKPDAHTAARLIADGQHCWNAGIFVASARVLLDMLQRHQPDLYRGLDGLAQLHGTDGYAAELAKVWPTLLKISIDHAIAEPAAASGDMMVVPAPLVWKDLGDFASLSEWRRLSSAPSTPRSPLSMAGGLPTPPLSATSAWTPSLSPSPRSPLCPLPPLAPIESGPGPKTTAEAVSEAAASLEEEPVIVLGDESSVFFDDATGFIVPGSGRVIGCIGLQDVVIVDTKDALLVMHKSRAQEIKQLANRCKLAFPTLS